MLRPYKVKAYSQVETGGTIYLSGQIVYLDREGATLHSNDIEPIAVITDESSPPFETKLTAYKRADLSQIYYLEKYTVDILSITSGAISTVTTKSPHGLINNQPINLRIISNTLTKDFQLNSSVISEIAFTVPVSIFLPPDVELAEVGSPIDLTSKNYIGGLYQYKTRSISIVFNSVFQTEAGSRRILVTGKQQDLEQIKIEDIITIPGAVSNGIIEALGITESIAAKRFTKAIAINTPATAAIASQNVIANRTVFTQDVGESIPGKNFVFSTNNLYGKLTLSLEKAFLTDLSTGLYPIKIYEIFGDEDIFLFYGVCEVIE